MSTKWQWLVLIIVLTGCSSTRIVNEVQMIHTLGYDRENDKIKGTAITHKYEKDHIQLELLETRTSTLFDVFPDINASTSFQLELGQLRSVLVGKEYAKNGLATLMHALCRDPNIGFRLQLAVAEPSAETILKLNERLNIPFFFSNSIEQNIKTLNMPKTNLHVFLFNYYGEGRDPFLPYYVVRNDRIKLDGLALFQKDKFVHAINSRESFLLKIMLEKATSGQYQVDLKNTPLKGYGLLKNLYSEVNYDVDTSNTVPSVSVKLKLRGQLKDFSTLTDLSEPDELRAAEKVLSLYLQNEMTNFITRLQRLKVDPIGFGDRVRGKSPDWNYEHFKEIYPRMDIAVKAQVTLEHSGLGE